MLQIVRKKVEKRNSDEMVKIRKVRIKIIENKQRNKNVQLQYIILTLKSIYMFLNFQISNMLSNSNI